MKRSLIIETGRLNTRRIVRRATVITPDMRIPKVSPLPMPGKGERLTLRIIWERDPEDRDVSINGFDFTEPAEVTEDTSERAQLYSLLSEMKKEREEAGVRFQRELQDWKMGYEKLANFYDNPDPHALCGFRGIDGVRWCRKRLGHLGEHLFPDPDLKAPEGPDEEEHF